MLPYNFKVDWSSGQKGYSKQLESSYYEFPVIWTNKPDTKGIGPDRASTISYKVLAIKNGNTPPQYYVLKFKGSLTNSNIAWSDLKRFTGHIYVINHEGQKILAQKYADGQYESEIRFISQEEYKELQNNKRRLYQVCYTETTYHYTDWYQLNMDGSIEYLYTFFEGVTYNEVCETRDDGSGGGSSGGSGPYYEYTDRMMPDYLLSGNPWIQYPEDSDYHEKYPKLTEYLRNKLPNIASNDYIVDAILKYTDLSREEIKKELQWGEGPILEVIQLNNACAECSENTAGLFDPSNPNVIYLDTDIVNLLENTSNQVMGDAFSFWVGATVLHEFVHYGDNVDGNQRPFEEGVLFEKDAYGQDVTRTNAVEILFRKSKNY